MAIRPVSPGSSRHFAQVGAKSFNLTSPSPAVNPSFPNYLREPPSVNSITLNDLGDAAKWRFLRFRSARPTRGRFRRQPNKLTRSHQGVNPGSG
jgi:hypothetical protein